VGCDDTDDALTAAVADAVLRYLDANPNAADTAEGIHEWWLNRELASARKEQVRRALERLVAQGTLERRLLTGGQVLYASPSGRHQPNPWNRGPR